MEYHLSGHRALQRLWASKVFSKAIYLRRKSTLNSLRGHVTELQISLVPNWWDGRLFWSNTLWRVHEQAADGYCRIINDKLLLRSSLIVKEFEIHSILCLLICRRLTAHNTHTHTHTVMSIHIPALRVACMQRLGRPLSTTKARYCMI